MNSAIDSEKFKQGLIEDLASAEATAKQGSVGRGGEKEPSDFAPRSLRIKNKAVGKAELDKLNMTIDTAIKDLVTEANFADSIQAKRYENDLRKKFNQYKLMMIRQAGQTQKDRAKEQIDQESKAALWKSLAGLAEQGASLTISNLKAPSWSAPADPKGPGFFDQENPYSQGLSLPQSNPVDFDNGNYEMGSQFGRPRKIGLT